MMILRITMIYNDNSNSDDNNDDDDDEEEEEREREAEEDTGRACSSPQRCSILTEEIILEGWCVQWP